MRRAQRGIGVDTVSSCIAVVTPLPSLGWSPRIIRHADEKYGAFQAYCSAVPRWRLR
jgi:hypothetical protein